MLHIERAEYLGDHRVHLWFSDDSNGEVDMSNVLTGPVFAPLIDPAYFQTFRLEGHTLAWANGADFAPEYLHSLGHQQSAV
jgi:hypothetical protein